MELEKLYVGIEVDEGGVAQIKRACGNIKKNINEVQKSAQKALNTGEDVNDIVVGVGGLGNAIKNKINNPIKKVIGSLLGVAGVYAVIRKATSAYLNQNKELQERISNLWYSLGSLLAPILEWIVGVAEKLVGYIQAFARGLGISTAKATSLAKATNKALAGFDELNNLSSSGDSNALTSISDPEINQGLADALEKLGKKVANLAGKIGDLIVKIQSKFDFLEPIENWTDGAWTNIIFTALEGLFAFKSIGLLKKLGFSGNALLYGFDIAIVVSSVVRFAEAVIEGDKFKISNEAMKNLFAAALGISAGMLTGNLLVGFTVYSAVKVVLDIVESIGSVTKASYTPTSTVTSVKYDTNGNYVTPTSSTKTSKSTTTDKKVRAASILDRFDINSYDVGTNYVPSDGLAYLHQGEAVVPKNFNEDYFIQSNETNSLLRELISLVGSSNIRAYVSQREIGKAAVSYINNQSRIMGGSLV